MVLSIVRSVPSPINLLTDTELEMMTCAAYVIYVTCDKILKETYLKKLL